MVCAFFFHAWNKFYITIITDHCEGFALSFKLQFEFIIQWPILTENHWGFFLHYFCIEICQMTDRTGWQVKPSIDQIHLSGKIGNHSHQTVKPCKNCVFSDMGFYNWLSKSQNQPQVFSNSRLFGEYCEVCPKFGFP